jgi:hypothetical protein
MSELRDLGLGTRVLLSDSATELSGPLAWTRARRSFRDSISPTSFDQLHISPVHEDTCGMLSYDASATVYTYRSRK